MPYPLGKQTNQIRGQSRCWDTVSLTQQCVQLCLHNNEQGRAGMHYAVWIGFTGCAGLTETVVSPAEVAWWAELHCRWHQNGWKMDYSKPLTSCRWISLGWTQVRAKGRTLGFFLSLSHCHWQSHCAQKQNNFYFSLLVKQGKITQLFTNRPHLNLNIYFLGQGEDA